VIVPDRSVVDRDWFDIVRRVEGLQAPLELEGTTARLLVQQKVEVVGEHTQTITYVYRLQESDDPASWLVRWEYFRRPPRADYMYPLAHLHVNAAMEERDLPHIHLPTRRVPLELVLWDLIAEWGVRPLDPGWQKTLEESIEGFDERQQIR
jgi:hypothetical protein